MLITLIILYILLMGSVLGACIEANGATTFEIIMCVLFAPVTLSLFLGIIIGNYLKKNVEGFDSNIEDFIKPDNK